MSDFPFDTVGFDLDGTLVDSSEDLAVAVNHVLASLDRPPLPLDSVRAHIGGGGRRMLRLSLAEAGIDEPAALDAHVATMLDFYAQHIAVHTRPFPGLLRALDQLAELGMTLAVATNKGEALARRLLDALGLTNRFATIIGGDTVANGKPAPDALLEMVRRCSASRAAFVGDSRFDVAAAAAAGMPCIAVSFGYPGGPLGDLAADRIIDHFDELVPALREIGTQTGR